MDDTPSAQRVRRDADNLSVADAHVAHGIQASLRIHDSTAIKDDIELLR
jgi:hypothetical protein